MDNSSNPVTETEMRAFFERFATQFVNLSAQSVELAELKRGFQDLSRRVEYLNESNDRLHKQVDILVAERDKARQEATENLELAKSYERERDIALEDGKEWARKYDELTKVRDAREGDYRTLYDTYSEALRSGSQARNERDAAKRELEATKAELARVKAENDARKMQLDAIQAVFANVAAIAQQPAVKPDITAVETDPWPNAKLREEPKQDEQDEPWWKRGVGSL